MLDPHGPSAPSSTPVTTRETHLANKCLPMRLPISPRHLNPFKQNGLKPHDYEIHIPGTDCVTPCDASCQKMPPDASQISAPPPQPIETEPLKTSRL